MELQHFYLRSVIPHQAVRTIASNIQLSLLPRTRPRVPSGRNDPTDPNIAWLPSAAYLQRRASVHSWKPMMSTPSMSC